MTEKYCLIVRFYVDPKVEARLIGWLDGGHMNEVTGQPGFLWCRRLKLADRNADGWTGYSTIYGIDSRSSFERYEKNAALKSKFAAERAPFEKHMKIDRVHGEVVAHA